MLVGEVASCIEDDSANESKGGNNESTLGNKSANISKVKDFAGLPGKDLTAR